MCRIALSRIGLVLLFFALSASSLLAETPGRVPVSFSDQGKDLDNFLVRTLHKISESWNLGVMEIQMAARSVQDTQARNVTDLKVRAGIAQEEIRQKSGAILQEKAGAAKDAIVKSAEDAVLRNIPGTSSPASSGSPLLPAGSDPASSVPTAVPTPAASGNPGKSSTESPVRKKTAVPDFDLPPDPPAELD